MATPNDSVRAARRWKKSLSTFGCYVLLILVAIVCAGPFLWLVYSSFRTNTNIYKFSFDLSTLTMDNYSGVVEFMNYPRYIGNTMIYTISKIVLDILLSSLCAYPLATMRFKGKNIVMGLLLGTMIIPAAAGNIVNYLTISKLGLMNTYLAVILPGATGAFSIILMRQAYLQVPKELMESARIDGAGEFLIWRKIMIPGIRATVSTIVIFDFIGSWNSYLWPLIVLTDSDKYPLATALQYLNGMFNYRFSYVAAGAVISIIPVIIVFLIFQKNYIEAVAGALKG